MSCSTPKPYSPNTIRVFNCDSQLHAFTIDSTSYDENNVEQWDLSLINSLALNGTFVEGAFGQFYGHSYEAIVRQDSANDHLWIYRFVGPDGRRMEILDDRMAREISVRSVASQKIIGKCQLGKSGIQ